MRKGFIVYVETAKLLRTKLYESKINGHNAKSGLN